MATYAIGIDLGTTNSVLAYTRLDQDAAQPQVLSVPQLVAPATVESRLQLPSFLYLSSEHEADTGNYDLPWQQGGQDAVGELARQQAAAIPMHTVAAAKSWLCYSRVDRHQPILPWGAPSEVPKVSPVDVSRRYLAHLVAAWHHEFPAAPIAEQRVVLTVPASFDASARELTREAALAAGLPAESDPARRTASGPVCLAGRPWRPMAPTPWRRRHSVSLRRGWRYDRFHPHRCRRHWTVPWNSRGLPLVRTL